jgi:hypothetical protein
MSDGEIRVQVQHQLDQFYLQRAQRLAGLAGLRDLLGFICDNPLISTNLASEIVAGLIESYLAASESWWKELTSSPSFCRALILSKSSSDPFRDKYEIESLTSFVNQTSA